MPTSSTQVNPNWLRIDFRYGGGAGSAETGDQPPTEGWLDGSGSVKRAEGNKGQQMSAIRRYTTVGDDAGQP